jgi:MtaA/CmuA family methyltransferase
MDQRERLLRTLDREEVDRAPCASPLQTGTVAMMERCGAHWPAANDDPLLMTELALAAHRYSGLEAVRVPFDVTVDASAFGAMTDRGASDRQPAVLSPILKGPDDRIETLPDPELDGRAPVLLSSVGMLARRFSAAPVICGLVGPFMLACQLRGLEAALFDIVLEPSRMRDLLETTTAWDKAFSERAIEAGADIITIVDATSTGAILGTAQYGEHALPFQTEVVNRIGRCGARAVLHICGDTSGNLGLMVRTGANGISLDQCMDMAMAKGRLGEGTALMGNIDPVGTLWLEGPMEVGRSVARCLAAGVDVIAPGCGLAPHTPLGNVRAMVQATRRRH